MVDKASRFDLIVYGASGFTGRLVAEYLAATHKDVRWAMAGRDRSKLEAVRAEIDAGGGAEILHADARDASSLEAMAARATVVVTTVGPYQRHGEPLIAACVRTGADYVDLCGEPAWMAAMISKYDAAAKASGARIVFSCGFDSIPFDCGVFFLQAEAKQRFGAPCPRVRGRVRAMKGGFSGGTVASLLATVEAGARDPNVPALMADPYALVGDRPALVQPDGAAATYDSDLGQWAAPFVMAAINTKNVHRSNALMNWTYGRAFTYEEMQLMGAGEAGARRARAAVRTAQTQTRLLAFAPTRALLRRFALPKPGQGPSRHERETGHYDVLFVGDFPDGRALSASVAGDKDPGYGSTSKMIAEAGLCIAATPRTQTPGGIWTPAAAMGAALIARLQEKAGLTFRVET